LSEPEWSQGVSARCVELGDVGSETTYYFRGWPPKHPHGNLGADEKGPRLRGVYGDVVHLLKFWPTAYSVQNENGPRGGAVPKGPLFHKRVNAGIPAPRCSRREPPIT